MFRWRDCNGRTGARQRMNETQITFLEYSTIMKKIASLEKCYGEQNRRFYHLCNDQEQHIRDLRSEVRHLRNLLRIKEQEQDKDGQN
jgi:hypothetical protein